MGEEWKRLLRERRDRRPSLSLLSARGPETAQRIMIDSSGREGVTGCPILKDGRGKAHPGVSAGSPPLQS